MYLLLGAGSFLCGSIPFGKIIGFLSGVDIQKRGSGNIGFANVRRILGWKAGIATLLGDVAKGYVPVTIAYMITNDTTVAFCMGALSILGHIFPPWLRFRGGKGIATGLGVVAALNLSAAIVGSLLYIFGVYVYKKSSTASVIGVVAVVVTATIMNPHTWWQNISLLMIASWTLRNNIAGTVANYER